MSLLIRTDVTSVKFHETFVLAGIGSWVHVFDKVSGKLVQRFVCLKGQKIYGFVPSASGSKILVFGGKQFTVLNSVVEADNTEVFTQLFKPVMCNDWLHSGIWIDEEDVALLTAHNVVQKRNTSSQTISSQHHSKDNSILYSGLLLPLKDDVLVMAGTVFSEVIIHRCGEETLHRLKGHKGVIFSISCDPLKGIIVTTSDDRSVRIWEPNITLDSPRDTIGYWKNIEIVCKHELYGHTARVMKSCITSDNVISVGEDSSICFWNLHGKLAKKTQSHQNGCIWSVDVDKYNLVTGGGDCAVILHPLTLATDYCKTEILNLENGAPKKVVFMARENMAIQSEDDELIYYNVEEKSKRVRKLNHESTRKFVSVSSCKQMIAIADMNGKLDVFAENCKDTAFLINIINTKLQNKKVLTMQWAGNRHLVIGSQFGAISVHASKDSVAEPYTWFYLRCCKEMWLTAAAIDRTDSTFVFGDHCGSVHIFHKGEDNPIKSLNKVHGKYGPTSIILKGSEVITTGRDGTIKYFSLAKDQFKLMSTKELEFKWVEKFLDKDENLICGFQERVFVVFNIKTNCKLLEVDCGGGHRSWDAIRFFNKVNNNYEEFIRLAYLKKTDINIVTLQLSKIAPKSLINGSHSKEINCLKIYKTDDISATFFISGGEDTTLRISSINSGYVFKDEVIFKQLSSIRTLQTCTLDDNSVLLIAAGGRAQISIKILKFLQIDGKIIVKSRELITYMVKGTDKERKGNQNWRNCSIDFDPETRIMDLDYIKSDNIYTIFVGCSDASLRVFSFIYNETKAAIVLIEEYKYHNTCILKTVALNFMNEKLIVTCTTRGVVAFWNLTTMPKNAEPFFVTQTNKSGINSFNSKNISDEKLLIVTAGDDNTMHLVLLEADQSNLSSMKVLQSKAYDKYHSSQITGVYLLDKYILSTSIDQRITLFEWTVEGDNIDCTFLSQTCSDVADIQGMDLISHTSSTITICVFGKGLEVIEIPKRTESQITSMRSKDSMQ